MWSQIGALPSQGRHDLQVLFQLSESRCHDPLLSVLTGSFICFGLAKGARIGSTGPSSSHISKTRPPSTPTEQHTAFLCLHH